MDCGHRPEEHRGGEAQFLSGGGRDPSQRNLLWQIFDVCDRLGITDQEFYALPGSSQKQWIAFYELQRDDEKKDGERNPFRGLMRKLGRRR